MSFSARLFHSNLPFESGIIDYHYSGGRSNNLCSFRSGSRSSRIVGWIQKNYADPDPQQGLSYVRFLAVRFWKAAIEKAGKRSFCTFFVRFGRYFLFLMEERFCPRRLEACQRIVILLKKGRRHRPSNYRPVC